MVKIESYISTLIDLLRDHFGERLVYVGLQGSYLRGEATDESDIDIMVVINDLSVDDLASYRKIIRSMEYADKSCGFICSKEDLSHWNPLEIANLLNSTKDHWGTLCELVPAYSEEDIRNFVKLSVNNLYHELCHRYIHSRNNADIEALTGTYKGAFFILQNLYYLRRGVFAATKAELMQLLEGKDRAVMERSVELNSGAPCDFADSFQLLFDWCQETVRFV